MAELEEDSGGADALGARIGLALVFGVGFVLAGVTSATMWALYPPTHSQWWTELVVVLVSAVLLLGIFLGLRRRVGQQASDWFVLGYVGAFLLFVVLVMGGGVVQFVRDHVASSIGMSVSAAPSLVARA